MTRAENYYILSITILKKIKFHKST